MTGSVEAPFADSLALEQCTKRFIRLEPLYLVNESGIECDIQSMKMKNDPTNLQSDNNRSANVRSPR